jgi:uncharacterized membrane protein HdeD (DUF308 family)
MDLSVPNERLDAAPWLWWLPLLFGIATIVIGGFLLFQPAIGAVLIVQLVAISWLIGGLFDVITSLSDRGPYWGAVLAGGIISALLGLAALVFPLAGTQVALSLLFWLIVIAAFVSGVLDIVRGLRGPTRSWWVVLLGVLKIVVGFVLLENPVAGTRALVPLLGLVLLATGILAVVIAFQVRGAMRRALA